MLKDWAGRSGWLWKFKCSFRGMNLANDVPSVWAVVTGKRETPGFGLVSVEPGICGGDGKNTRPGSAMIALPYRGGASVPYPFVPPELPDCRPVG